MPNPVAAWHQEHAYFQRLLVLLQNELDVFAEGGTPNYVLMQDIISYLHEYADHVHHPREDEAFRRLAVRCPDLVPTLARLQQEHRIIARSGETLQELLREASDGDAMIPRSQVEVAAATYLVYYGNHIAKEEEDVLPRAEQVLKTEDWKAAFEAAPLVHDPLFGETVAHRFSDLRRRIALEA